MAINRDDVGVFALWVGANSLNMVRRDTRHMSRKSERRRRGNQKKKQTKRRRLRALANAMVRVFNEPIGWWDYDETDRPTLINRYSGERLRMGPRVRIARRLWDQRWIRLDYLYDDLVFPVLACWMPEQGHIVVDYVSSVELWREETGGMHLYPPYGTWVRVDDCVLDAIWCWPGILAALHRGSQHLGRSGHGVAGFIGGWCNGAWRPEYLRVTTPGCSPEKVAECLTDMTPSYSELSVHLPLRRLMPLEKPAPSPWMFIDVASHEEHERLGYTHFEGSSLVHFSDQSNYAPDYPYWLPCGSDSVAIHGTVPQMRACDGSRVFYPLSAGILTFPDMQGEGWPMAPSHGNINYACLESGLTGVMRWWAMSRNHESLPMLDKDRLRINLRLIGGTHRRSADEDHQIVDRMGLTWPKVGREVNYEDHGPWVLSAESRRRLTRLVQDARLFWRGTEQRPECWNVVGPDILSFRGQGTVTVRSPLLGGTLLNYDIHARLGDDRPWTKDGFTLGPFMGKR